MTPVVTKPEINFSQLASEMAQTDAPDLQELARKQFIAKLQVKKNYLTEDQADKFETIVGKSPAEFAKELKTMKLEQVAEWFTNNPSLGEILDAKVSAGGFKPAMVIHDGEDGVINTTTGYGDGQKPEDYLTAFNDFINANSNRMAAIQTVVNKPWRLSRQSLKELAVVLDQNHFREKELQTAWKETKQEDIAARIIGFIRQAAIGEALIPWEQRVDNALENILNRHPWKTPQKQWLELIAKQMKANTIVDETVLDQGVFKTQGGIKRANKLFEQPIAEVLEQFNKALWQ